VSTEERTLEDVDAERRLAWAKFYEAEDDCRDLTKQLQHVRGQRDQALLELQVLARSVLEGRDDLTLLAAFTLLSVAEGGCYAD